MGNALLSSKVIVSEEPPRIRSITALPTAVKALTGVVPRGVIGVARLYTEFETWRNVHGPATPDSLEVFAAVQAFFEEGGQFLWFTRTAHYVDITNAATLTAAYATAMVQTSSATSATIAGVNPAPYDLEPGDDVSISTDGAAAQTATIAATASSSSAAVAAPYALTNANTLIVLVDDRPAQTVTFLTADFVDINAATPAEVAAKLNANLVGCFADVNGGQVRITSDRRGTSSLIDATGGTDAAALGFPAAVAGTGNVANVDAVTLAEVVSIIEAATTGLEVEEQTPGSGIPDLVADSTGAASTLEITASTNFRAAVGWPLGEETGAAGVLADTTEFSGKTQGAYANDIVVRILDASSGDADSYDLHVVENGFVVETFQNVTSATVEAVLDSAGSGSYLIAALDQGAAGAGRPANGDYPLAGGDDGLVGLGDSDFIGSSVSDTGLRSFDVIEGITLLTVPGRATAAVHNAMVQYAEVTRSGSIFCVLDPPEALNAAAIIDYIENVAALKGTTEHAAMYWPRVKIINPNKDVFGDVAGVTVPNSGHVCGIYARSDASEPGGIYQAPAGDRGILRTIIGLEDDPDGAERHQVYKETVRDLVYPKLINPISNQGGALNLDGTRTLKSNGNFPGVAERRGVIFIEQSVKAGIQFARHKNHTEQLRGEVDRTIDKFLRDQMKLGAFRTKNPATAFYIDVSKALNTDAVVFSNQLLVRVGLATNKTVDWVHLKFTQDTRALEQELAQA